MNPEGTTHYLMYQVVSSAIGNIPPPSAVINNVNNSAKTMNAGPVGTKEKMLKVFKEDVDGKPLKKGKLLGRRNYCIFQGEEQGGITATLQVESIDYNAPSKPYGIYIPPLNKV